MICPRCKSKRFRNSFDIPYGVSCAACGLAGTYQLRSVMEFVPANEFKSASTPTYMPLVQYPPYHIFEEGVDIPQGTAWCIAPVHSAYSHFVNDKLIAPGGDWGRYIIDDYKSEDLIKDLGCNPISEESWRGKRSGWDTGPLSPFWCDGYNGGSPKPFSSVNVNWGDCTFNYAKPSYHAGWASFPLPPFMSTIIPIEALQYMQKKVRDERNSISGSEKEGGETKDKEGQSKRSFAETERDVTKRLGDWLRGRGSLPTEIFEEKNKDDGEGTSGGNLNI